MNSFSPSREIISLIFQFVHALNFFPSFKRGFSSFALAPEASLESGS
jgi:hypothetical protein